MRKCRRQLGSDPDGIGQPYPEKPAGMLPSRYAWLLDRLDAAEDDLDLPLTLAGRGLRTAPTAIGWAADRRACVSADPRPRDTCRGTSLDHADGRLSCFLPAGLKDNTNSLANGLTKLSGGGC